jgi:ribonuclease HI
MDNPKAPSRPPQPHELVVAPVGAVLQELGVTYWDALLVGDGSGSGWHQGCGWASVLIDKSTNQRKLFTGAMNPGTVNRAELLAYLHAMDWYSNGPGKERLKHLNKVRPGSIVQVHVITDSELTVKQGQGLACRKVNSAYWAGIDEITRKGFKIHWHWMSRDKIGLNQLTDHISREARKAVEALQPPPGTSIYDFNPEQG